MKIQKWLSGFMIFSMCAGLLLVADAGKPGAHRARSIATEGEMRTRKFAKYYSLQIDEQDRASRKEAIAVVYKMAYFLGVADASLGNRKQLFSINPEGDFDPSLLGLINESYLNGFIGILEEPAVEHTDSEKTELKNEVIGLRNAIAEIRRIPLYDDEK